MVGPGKTLMLMAAVLLGAALPLSAQTGGEMLGKYPSADLMNSFTGVVPGLWQTENSGRTGVRFNALNSTLTIRSFSNPTYIVDGIVVPELTELQITPEEIESVEVLSNVLDKLKYGPEVATGAIYIRTLRGMKNGRRIRVGLEKGVDVVDRFPEWVSDGVTYATLNNLARSNAGYVTRYSDFTINEFRRQDESDPGFPVVDWRSKMFKDTRPYQKAYALVSGGGESVQYSANLGAVNQGDIFADGPVSDYSRFNAKMDLTAKVNQRLDVGFGFIGFYGLRRTPLGRYGTTDNVTEFPSLWLRARNTPPVEYPIVMGEDEATGVPVFPVSNAYPDHPYGSLVHSGYYRETTRCGITRANVNYDLSFLLDGLKSESMVSYNIFYLLRTGQGRDYIGYNFDSASWSSASSSHQGASASSESEYKTLYLQGLQFDERLSWDWTGGDHALAASFTYHRSNVAYNLQSSYHNQQNYILDAKYSFAGKYIAEIVANYAGTSSLKPGHRYGLFPAVSLGWIASKEESLRKVEWLNWLKVWGQAGIIGNETYGDQFLWQSRYTKSAEINFGPYSLNQWFGSNSWASRATTLERVANEDLGWERLCEASLGFNSVLLRRLEVSAALWTTLRSGMVTDVSSISPMAFGVTTKYDNYNTNLYYGLEMNAAWNSTVGPVKYRIAAGAMLPRSRFVRYCENVVYGNLSHEGRSTTMILGYDYLGRFASEAEIDSSAPQLFDAKLSPGDLRYRDVNEDGVVDSNDRTVIGDAGPKLLYSLNIGLSWKKLGLTIVGTGKAFFQTMLNNGWYWNGWGDGNYSAFVRDNLDTGLYPRLSYVQSQNNFRNSQFWMEDGGFFKIQCVELSYDIPFRKGGAENVRVFTRGANLLTLSKIKDCDPEAMTSGVSDYPLFRTFTGGIRLTF